MKNFYEIAKALQLDIDVLHYEAVEFINYHKNEFPSLTQVIAELINQ
jgi:hypothetical protein